MSVTITYTVAGMTCGHCERAVSGELSQLPGVREVRVDLAAGEVAVTSDGQLPIDEIRAAVDEAGYELTGVGTERGA